MAYTTASALRVYLGGSSTGDSALMNNLIDRAQATIERYTGRVFEHSTVGATRYYTVGEDTYGRVLVLDEDVCSIDNVVTDADGTPTTISSTEYITYPRNDAPYYEIELLSSTTKSWTYTDNAANGVYITGKWSYSTAPPADIVHATIRLAAYFYRQRDAQVFDVTAIPDAGIITVPKGMPPDVKIILDPYRKVI